MLEGYRERSIRSEAREALIYDLPALEDRLEEMREFLGRGRLTLDIIKEERLDSIPYLIWNATYCLEAVRKSLEKLSGEL